MQSIVFRSTLVAFGSVALSLGLAATVVPALGGTLDGNAWLMCILCPLVIAWPASAHAMLQKQRLLDAMGALEKAHAELSAAHGRLHEKSRRDTMTGMLNREAFFQTVAHSIEGSQGSSLLVIDADHFKSINDSAGHQTGDEALLEITRGICRAVGRDGVIGRIGGEEFGVLLPGVDETKARSIGERIRREVEQIVFRHGERRIALTVSVGGATHGAGKGLADLFREADRRLYEAKRRGRNRVVYDAEFPRAA